MNYYNKKWLFFLLESTALPTWTEHVLWCIQFLASSAKFALKWFIPLTSRLIKVQIQKLLALDSRKIEDTG